MNQSIPGPDYSNKNSSIYPYYKENNVFERDDAYYNQLLNNTRRNQNIGNAGMGTGYNSSRGRSGRSGYNGYPQQQQPQYQQVETQYNNVSGYQPHPHQQSIANSPNSHQQYADNHDITFSQPMKANIQANQAVMNLASSSNRNAGLSNGFVDKEDFRRESQQNALLKQRLDNMINFRDPNDDGTQVTKKYHYNRDSEEGRTIARQQEQIQNLLNQINRNNADVYKYKSAIGELQKSMNNIQSVDREIYKQLQNLSNRDQELLDRANTALARGASREEVVAILDKIIA